MKGLFYMTQKCLPLLRPAGTRENPARVINIGSIDGIGTPVYESYVYSSSKAAVHHLTRVLGARLVKENILVNAIAPGAFPSNMLGSAVGHDYSYIEKTNPKYGYASNQVGGNNLSRLNPKHDGVSRNGSAMYSGNSKFVHDGSDYARFKKLQAINRNYNDITHGGDSGKTGQQAIRRMRR